ncbi:MAG: peptide chain release factor N(5)-glutamine methyltransferase [Chthoniobacterales bacterium]|nr:peptide chain release factor N(5)-glutamine methyltransferase [Chthoniobacterales bacterium]
MKIPSAFSLQPSASISSTSLLEVLQGGTAFLKKQGVEQARLNVELLLAHVLKIPRLELYLQFDRMLGEAEKAPLRELLRERGRAVPLQHLLGTTEFFGRTFCSDARGLIPRPETEQLVERALTHHQASRLLDVGTGSGVIAITLALEKPTASIDAIDFSPEALSLAQENAALHRATNIQWHQGNLLQEQTQSWDLIVANLPYIDTEEIPTLSREVQYDPIMALDGGKSGLVLIQQLIEQAPAYLTEGGCLLLEIGKDQEKEVIKLLEINDYSDILALPDYQGVLRFVEARMLRL